VLFRSCPVEDTGHKLQVEVDAYVAPNQPAANEADVTIIRETAAGEEDHTWMFPIKASDLTLTSAAKGALKLTTKEISPFGALSLTMTPKSDPTTQKCDGTAAASTTPVKLVGSFFFNTRSSATGDWGKVGYKNSDKTFTFHGKNTVTRMFAGGAKCLNASMGDITMGDTTLPCVSSVIWDASTPTVDLNGIEMYGVNLVAGSRFAALHEPTGAMRLDAVFGMVPAPTLTLSPNAIVPSAFDALLVAVGHGSTSTGAATLFSQNAATPETAPCGSGRKTVRATAWPDAIYHNGAVPFAMKAQAFGDIHATNNATATLIAIAPTAATPSPTPTPTSTSAASPSIAHLATASNRAAAIAAAERYLHSKVSRRLG